MANTRRLLSVVLLMSDSHSAAALSNSKLAASFSTSAVPYKNPGKKWSDMSIQTAQELTISHREKLAKEGVMNIQRPIQIIGRPVENPEQLLRNSGGDTKQATTKLLHFQRHGQGFHNVLCAQYRELTGKTVDLESKDPKRNPMLKLEVLDSPLTEVGRQQCLSCQDEASLLNPQLVIVSPLWRAIESATLTWSAHRKENSQVPWVAHEGCREELGLLVCNQRRTIDEMQASFPDIDFSLCPDNEDTLFTPDRLETALEKTERIYQFLEYVRQLPQNEIAVVGHSAWLFFMCNAVMEIGDPELSSWFLTSEIRSMQVTFVDRERSKEEN